MPERKHSKAPWSIMPGHDKSHVATSDGRQLAWVNRTVTFGPHEGAANMALVLAAPELLDELEQARKDVNHLIAIMSQIKEATGEGPEDEDLALVNQIIETYAAPSAAIEKATKP
jgi:hypothetical protein